MQLMLLIQMSLVFAFSFRVRDTYSFARLTLLRCAARLGLNAALCTVPMSLQSEGQNHISN